jgi:hypothetical protein
MTTESKFRLNAGHQPPFDRTYSGIAGDSVSCQCDSVTETAICSFLVYKRASSEQDNLESPCCRLFNFTVGAENRISRTDQFVTNLNIRTDFGQTTSVFWAIHQLYSNIGHSS